MLVKKFVWLINNDQSDTLKGGWVGGGSNRYGEKHNFVWSNWYESRYELKSGSVNTDVQKLSLFIVSFQSEAEEISHHNLTPKTYPEDSPDKVKEAETSARMRGTMGEATTFSLNHLQSTSLWGLVFVVVFLSGAISVFSFRLKAPLRF